MRENPLDMNRPGGNSGLYKPRQSYPSALGERGPKLILPGKEIFRGPMREKIRPMVVGQAQDFEEISEWTYTDVNNPAVNYYGVSPMLAASDRLSSPGLFGTVQRAYVFFPRSIPVSGQVYTLLMPFTYLYNATSNVGFALSSNGIITIQAIVSMGVLTPQTLTWANQGGLTLGSATPHIVTTPLTAIAGGRICQCGWNNTATGVISRTTKGTIANAFIGWDVPLAVFPYAGFPALGLVIHLLNNSDNMVSAASSFASATWKQSRIATSNLSMGLLIRGVGPY